MQGQRKRQRVQHRGRFHGMLRGVDLLGRVLRGYVPVTTTALLLLPLLFPAPSGSRGILQVQARQVRERWLGLLFLHRVFHNLHWGGGDLSSALAYSKSTDIIQCEMETTGKESGSQGPRSKGQKRQNDFYVSQSNVERITSSMP